MISVSLIVLAFAVVTTAMYPMNPGNMYPGNMNPGNMYPGNMNPGNMYPGNMNPGNMYPGNMYPGTCIQRGRPCGSSFGKCCIGTECKGYGMSKTCQPFPIGK